MIIISERVIPNFNKGNKVIPTIQNPNFVDSLVVLANDNLKFEFKCNI